MRRRRPRRFRYRPANRRAQRLLRTALGVTAAVTLALALSVLARSARTARLNRSLAALHTADGARPEAEIAAPALEMASPAEGASPVENVSAAEGASPVEGASPGETASAARASSGLKLSYMGLPEGVSPEGANRSARTADGAVAGAFHEQGTTVLPEMARLLERNPDTVGWLYIQGIVSLPVVFRDNEAYLNCDFDGNISDAGTLFLDENHPLTPSAQHLLIHGHSMHDGSMFGLLTHYQRLSSLRAHPLISFSTLWAAEDYVVYAVARLSSVPGDPRYFGYANRPAFVSDSDFYGYASEVLKHSLYDIPVDVRPDDALLTLSTCLDQDRLVVFARRLRPGETKESLSAAVARARINN